MHPMSDSIYTERGNGIYRIDVLHGGTHSTACYALESGGRVAIIDAGARHAPASVKTMLQGCGLTESAVDFVMPTHVHLDHAGGCGAMMAQFPNARLVVHPKGQRHLVDPTRLAAGTIAVYGEETFKSSFGELLPIESDRIIAIEDGASVTLGDRELRCVHSPGHASHHYCVVDMDSRALFSGDTFGVSFREFDKPGCNFVFPTTSPVDFAPEQWHQTLDKLMSYEPSRVFVAHFDVVTEVQSAEQQLRAGIDAHARIARQCAGESQRKDAIKQRLTDYLLECLSNYASPLTTEQAIERMATDLEINAQGLDVWLQRQSQA